MRNHWRQAGPRWVIAILPTLLISGTDTPPNEQILLAQVRTIAKESEDAISESDRPSQIDLLEEADEREGVKFEIKAEDIRNWRAKVRSAYPPAPVEEDGGPQLTGSAQIKKLCGKNIQRPDLIQREQQLSETQAMLMEEMERVEEIQRSVKTRWNEVSAAISAASALQISAEQNCEEWGPGALTPEKSTGSESAESANAADFAAREERVQQVVKIMKSMKPKAAARILQGWDSELAVMALLRLPSRVGSKIVAELPPEVAGELTTLLAPPSTASDEQ